MPKDSTFPSAEAKPTDANLPLRARTHAGPYVALLATVFAIGAALVIFGVVRLGESTSKIEASEDAKPVTEDLAPEATDSLPHPLNLDREILPSNSPVDDPATDVPGTN